MKLVNKLNTILQKKTNQANAPPTAIAPLCEPLTTKNKKSWIVLGRNFLWWDQRNTRRDPKNVDHVMSLDTNASPEDNA